MDADPQVPDWLPRERRATPDVAKTIGLILKQNETIAERVTTATDVARDAMTAAAENREQLARLTRCYEQHCADTSWLPEMHADLSTLIGAMRFILTLQKVMIWLSKALAGVLAFVVTVAGINEYVIPWLAAALQAHKPPP